MKGVQLMVFGEIYQLSNYKIIYSNSVSPQAF